MFVIPADGVKVRDPITKNHLPAEGAEVQENTFWLRRVADGSVTRKDGAIEQAATRLRNKKQQIEG